MENATKAILMAGGILIALLILSITMNIWNSGTSAFLTIDEKRIIALKEEEMVKFSQYIGNMYGSEVENCIRRVITYNYVNDTQMVVNVDHNVGNSTTIPLETYDSLSQIVVNTGVRIPVNIDVTYRNDIYKGSLVTASDGTITSINFKKVEKK